MFEGQRERLGVSWLGKRPARPSVIQKGKIPVTLSVVGFLLAFIYYAVGWNT